MSNVEETELEEEVLETIAILRTQLHVAQNALRISTSSLMYLEEVVAHRLGRASSHSPPELVPIRRAANRPPSNRSDVIKNDSSIHNSMYAGRYDGLDGVLPLGSGSHLTSAPSHAPHRVTQTKLSPESSVSVQNEPNGVSNFVPEAGRPSTSSSVPSPSPPPSPSAPSPTSKQNSPGTLMVFMAPIKPPGPPVLSTLAKPQASSSSSSASLSPGPLSPIKLLPFLGWEEEDILRKLLEAEPSTLFPVQAPAPTIQVLSDMPPPMIIL